MNALFAVAAKSHFRHMVTPGGFRMSVAMTNCGSFGWVTDRKGYRYTAVDPETNEKWPAMPEVFMDLAREAATMAGYPSFVPDAPRLSPQNRPYVISSKPANGIGRRRDCFTLRQRAIARFRIERSKWCLLLWFHSAGVAPFGVIHGR